MTGENNYFNIDYEADILDKDASKRLYVSYMLSRTQSMFKYSGQPETIPERMLELYLQTNGQCIIAEHNEKLYAFTGGMGGVPDEYYQPTIYTVSNPYLKFSKNFKIGQDCVLIRSDSLQMGLLPMFSRYAVQLSENDISIRTADINLRCMFLLSAPDDKSYLSALKYIDNLKKGELSAVADNAFLDGIKIQPAVNSGTNSITQLIELQQYLKAGWFNDIGLQANYNMKRESINSNEAQLNDDCLLPLADNMLKCRKDGVEKVNQMFGTNISVDFSSAWVEKHDSGQPEKEDEEEKDPEEKEVEEE